MLNLEFELIAILILVAVIGILMGRFLCKSGESEEREKKKKVIHAFKTSQEELKSSRESVKNQSLELKEREDKIAKSEQEIENIRAKLNSSDKERVELLEELKILEKYKARFESLDREFKLQSKITEALKEEKISNQKEIMDLNLLIDGLNKDVDDLKVNNQKYQSLLKSKDDLYEALEEKSSLNYKEIVNEYKEFQENHNLDYDKLARLESDNEKIYHTLETIILERDDLVARLRAISSVVGAVGVDSGENRQPLLENR